MITVPDKKIVAIPTWIGLDISWETQYQSLRANKTRDWFIDHSYYCLPIVIGNQYGFVVKAEFDFTMCWDGGTEIDATTVTIPDRGAAHQLVSSHFGSGIVTVQNSFTLRTPPGVNLMTINPPNYFIDGLAHMTGVVECDNLRRDFTFNIKCTRPHHVVEIKKGDWIGAFIPIPRYFVDGFEMVDARGFIPEAELQEEFEISNEFGTERQTTDLEKPHQAGRRYALGEDVRGNRFADHQKATRPHPSCPYQQPKSE